MPSRRIVATGLSEMMRVLSHADRIMLIELLRSGDKTVGELADELALPATRISQHLSVMKLVGLIEVKTVGRSRIYHLVQVRMADWLVDGIDFVVGRFNGVTQSDIDSARRVWKADTQEPA